MALTQATIDKLNKLVGTTIDNGPGPLKITGWFTKDCSRIARGRRTIEAKPYLNVICYCSKEFKTGYNEIRSGRTNSCGCYKSKQTSLRCKDTLEDIIAKLPKESRLTPLKHLGTDWMGQSWVECECECGNIHRSRASDTINGKTKSCGCLQANRVSERSRSRDIKLPEGSMLTVIGDTGISRCGHAIWKFKCYCGNIFKASHYLVSTGNTRSCGCRQKESARQRSRDVIKLSSVYQRNKAIAEKRKQFPQDTQTALGTRSQKGIKKGIQKYCKCAYCNRRRFTQDHHITMVSKLRNRFIPVIERKFEFIDDVINHPRNIISLCKECHDRVHIAGTDTVDPHITKILKAIKRFAF